MYKLKINEKFEKKPNINKTNYIMMYPCYGFLSRESLIDGRKKLKK